MAALVTRHGRQPGYEDVPVPQIVLDRDGYRRTWLGLVEFGGYALADLYRCVVEAAVAYSESGGYRLPWRTHAEARAFCVTRGFDPGLIDVLFATSILDLPRGGRRAVVYVEPAYTGPIRSVREVRRGKVAKESVVP